jgi:hypothetical protein
MTMPARLQWAGLLITAVGAGLLFAVGVGLIVFGLGVLAFGVAAEREVVTDGSSKPATRT